MLFDRKRSTCSFTDKKKLYLNVLANLSLREWIRHFFYPNCEKLAYNKNILDVVIGLELNLLKKLYQTKNLKQNMSLEEMEHEIQELLKKGAIKQTSHSQIRLQATFSLRRKKRGVIGYW